MGGPNLEVFKFGMYIMFPIGFMYYFGINLDERFAVPDFWPKKGQTHEIPFEKDDIAEELERLKRKRLAARARRMAAEEQGLSTEVTMHQDEERAHPRPDILEATKVVSQDRNGSSRSKGWMDWLKPGDAR
ncbi:related to cytochrome-c oxidase assembly [Lecanosticta acicola]|uniref:Related to cytochrome-c oxidase assembly n=1 Tax=Lecanosticta acicola TaxID=111012 RepID=A0AAI8Z7X4_9PEZI|nr:related to cytochrome-c oxidase assembly [Lecanosticta acicola]